MSENENLPHPADAFLQGVNDLDDIKKTLATGERTEGAARFVRVRLEQMALEYAGYRADLERLPDDDPEKPGLLAKLEQLEAYLRETRASFEASESAENT